MSSLIRSTYVRIGLSSFFLVCLSRALASVFIDGSRRVGSAVRFRVSASTSNDWLGFGVGTLNSYGLKSQTRSLQTQRMLNPQY